MNKKITRWSLMNILFAILVSIPLWSIVVRTGYVLLNKNAYQSYYGETINETTYTKTEYDKLKIGNNYLFNNDTTITPVVITYRPKIQVSNFKNLNAPTTDLSMVNNLEFFMYPDNEPNRAVCYLKNDNAVIGELNFTNNNYNLTFTFEGYDTYANLLYPFNYFYEIGNNSYSYLDNVFDYSIDKFNSENDAHFDFVSNIANIFITEESYGWRYVEFVNWYFNYFIVISACYILFLAIIWFIAVIRRIIERSMHLI